MNIYAAITTDCDRFNAGHLHRHPTTERPIVSATRNGVIRVCHANGIEGTEFEVIEFDAATLIDQAFISADLQRYLNSSKFNYDRSVNANDVLARLGVY